MTTFEAFLRRERTLIIAVVAALTALAWIYVWQGAGMGMSALQMTRVTLFPHTQPETMPDMIMPAIAWFTVVAMWWIMMIAMMLPSATPLLLLYGRVLRHAAQPSNATAYVSTAFVAFGYLFVWLAFAIVATALQYLLQRVGVISTMMLWSRSAMLSALVLVSTGAYQLSPLKRTCLKHCRGPIDFLSRHWRPGRIGALRIGFEHGAWCVGCCWMLMALLFVGGVMNLVWIAALTLIVLVEKIAPHGQVFGNLAGALLIVWALATLLV